jgi:diaminopimelate decarboxylase
MILRDKLEVLEKYPTPFYYYDLELFGNTLAYAKSEADKYGYHLHYAVKANYNDRILEEVVKQGYGADCVSGQEVDLSIQKGFKASDIVFAGVGKTDAEINIALDHDIFAFNCESIQEIQIINELAGKKGKKAKIALRINPDVNANTHKYITTGLKENKFGIDMWQLDELLDVVQSCDAIELVGVHFHIGSQITDLTSFKNLAARVNKVQEWFLSRNILLKVINLGGGLGIDYENPDTNSTPDFASYFKIFNDLLEVQKGQEVHFELGRSLVGQCGSLISKVLYIKEGIHTNFVILDAGMTDLIRPMLYQAHHKIVNLSADSNRGEKVYDVVGPICESTDRFARALDLPETFRGDWFQILSAGAYGEVMKSDYNLKKLYPSKYSDEL